MLKKISVLDLKMGMNVVMSGSWFDHPFLRNRFVISSKDQIDKIIAAGFKYVTIDFSSGLYPREETPGVLCDTPPPEKWEPEKLVPPELREAVTSKSLAPKKKAKVVYESSRQLMQRLFTDPTSRNIGEAKKGIAEIVDVILSNHEIAENLLTITSYDFYTYTHSVNVGVLSILLAKTLFRNSGSHNMHELGAGFFLHDIGKVRVNPEIINKPGKLTEDEMTNVKAHPDYGYKILLESRHLTEECRVIVMQHHEKLSGSGYPNRLRGDDIHLYSRICSVVDVYDALTSERPYKQRLSPFDALRLMRERMMQDFESAIFDKFVLLLGSKPS